MAAREVTVETDGVALEGVMSFPERATGLVAFAHGSGSSRFSVRNRFVAEFLNQGGLATLLFDLLTAGEHELDQRTRALRFDIDLLSRRLVGAVDWLAAEPDSANLAIGLFGASTGAAAALNAAAQRPGRVAAVVSRGGRPDLAMESLAQVRAPTLLLVGGLDESVIDLNRQAAARMTAEHRLEIVPGATHLFEEPGTLETVAQLAREWFRQHLAGRAHPEGAER
ncbi:MAG TPA: dienelactone hydrolase family protein [Gammaproteobacteria bacterium]|nr:dienelactone hydrolase family protein [Gammaproteobacteria bacterium]